MFLGLLNTRFRRNLLKNTGTLEDKSPQVKFKKVDPARLSRYIEEHPDAYLKEIASEFNCSAPAIFLALKKLKITLKKDQSLSRNYVRLITKM